LKDFSPLTAVLFFLFVFSRQGCRQVAFDIRAVLCGQGCQLDADNPRSSPRVLTDTRIWLLEFLRDHQVLIAQFRNISFPPVQNLVFLYQNAAHYLYTHCGLGLSGIRTYFQKTQRNICFHQGKRSLLGCFMDEGLSEAHARSRCWFVDSQGLIVKNRGKLAAHKMPYAHEHEHIPNFLEAVKVLKPTAIIGACGKANTFTREVVETMAAHNERPIIFALSNPTANSECTAQQVYACSNGRALFASGSPFDPVELDGRQFVPGQGNNVYIFPGVGLGALACKAGRITNDMFLIAAKTLSTFVTPADLQH
jgi:hypothetical protein